MNLGCRLPSPPWPLPLGWSHPHLAAMGLVAPALALLVSLPTLGHWAARGRDAQCQEVWLLERRQRLSEVALGLDFEHDHGRKLSHPHEGHWLLRGLLGPPRQRIPRGLHGGEPLCKHGRTVPSCPVRPAPWISAKIACGSVAQRTSLWRISTLLHRSYIGSLSRQSAKR
jgi:hypothetical protein